MTPIRVVIADDQALVRTALRTVLSQHDDIHLVGEAADGPQAVAAAFALRPDVVVMDVRMPGLTGVEATRRILAGWPHPPPKPRVVVLTTFDLDEYVHAALRAGASGFVLKDNSPDRITDAVRLAASGESMLSPTVTRRLIDAFARLPATLLSDPPTVDDLTEREQAVAQLVARGLSNAQIARQLRLTHASVKGAVNRILTKLGLENRVQIALLVHGTKLDP